MKTLYKFKKAGVMLLVAMLVLTTLSSCNGGKKGGSSSVDNGKGESSKLDPSLGEDKWEYNLNPVKAEDLEETGDKQNRYLTIPNSRIVLNPYNFEAKGREVTQVAYSNSPTMPLNIGYCDPHFTEGRGVEMANAALFAESGSNGSGSGAQVLWRGELGNPSAWTNSGVKDKDYNVNFSNEKIDLSVTSGAEVAWQHVESKAVVDLTNSFLTVTVNNVTGGNFSIKVNRGNGDDTGLMEAGTAGTYTFNLQEITGWNGTTNLTIKLFSVGKGSKVSFSNVKIEKADNAHSNASSFSTTWRPDRLGFEASYPGGTKISGNDFFYDEKTIVRNFTAEGGKSLIIYGEYNGDASLDGNTILIKRETFKHAVTLSEDVKPKFYTSMVEVMSDSAGADSPSGKYGFWAYSVNLSEKKTINLVLAYDDKAVEDSAVVGFTRAYKGNHTEVMENRNKSWNELLTKVPEPSEFEITGIDNLGVTGEEVKHSYYVAWVQVIGNLLPKNPENNYNYPSLAAGKASLWAYGSDECAYSPIWEALYNTQLYAQIDPDVAWEMFIGFHSLVADDGMIAGESLPPNNARVAWSLHTVKPNVEALKTVQPQLDRHLKWRFENPRWIYLTHTPDKSQKDIDFVASALIDIEYLMKINEEIGLSEQNKEWEKRTKILFNSMKFWFFSDAQEFPNQYYSASSGGRSEGNQLWSYKALHVPGVEDKEVKRLLDAYDKRFNENAAFAGMGGVKYEPYYYTVLGLFENGRPDDGRKLLAFGIRDIIRSGIHAEGYNYKHTEITPLPEGVRPSLFGAAMMIECVLLYNGFRYDDGMPVLSNYRSGNGGVENWSLYGGTFNFKKSGNSFTYGGSSIGENKTVEVAVDGVENPFKGTNVHPLH